jgi:hypothetical protein
MRPHVTSRKACRNGKRIDPPALAPRALIPAPVEATPRCGFGTSSRSTAHTAPTVSWRQSPSRRIQFLDVGWYAHNLANSASTSSSQNQGVSASLVSNTGVIALMRANEARLLPGGFLRAAPISLVTRRPRRRSGSCSQPKPLPRLATAEALQREYDLTSLPCA